MPGKKRRAAQTQLDQISSESIDPSLEKSHGSEPESSCPIVGIGASAGGLEAVTQMLRTLPANTGMAFVLVQHLDPTHASMLTEILSRATTMPVSEVEDQMAVEPNRLYIIPPGTTMTLSGRLLQLSRRKDSRAHHRSIDHFFHSLAEEAAHKAIGVILSGTASDGTLGLQAIKAEGGITFAQDDTAQQNSMPRSAIAAGCVDFVLPPDEIAKEIARISHHPYIAAPATIQPEETAHKSNLGHVLELLRKTAGVDFAHYKHNTLYRRITRRIVLHKMEGLKDYVRFLESNTEELNALYQDILISVTSFFRNAETFEVLKTSIFPKLVEGRSIQDPVRVWVIGCSSGEEAYSMAISLAEFAELSSHAVPAQIFATDLNGVGIEKARTGLYSKDLVQDLPDGVRRFFAEADDDQYQVTKSIRDMCIFARHNVLADPPFSRIDLISCRNLLIYLEPILQQRVLSILHYALKPNGFLCLGSSETIGTYHDLFEVQDAKHKIYLRRPTTARIGIDLPLAIHPSVAQRRAVEPPYQLLVSGADIQREADRILLAKYAPAGVLINSDLEILQFRGNTGPFLAPAPGKPSLNILKMLREGLLVPLRAAVLKAKKEEVTMRVEGLRVKSNGGYREVSLEVIPVKENHGPVSSFLILFEEPGHTSRPLPSEQRAVPLAEDGDASEQENTRLRQELVATREYLQSVIEQQEASNEELQSANEEVQSANEELQSINEELETSKEEIQSSNEELATLNEELQHRNLELSLMNNDLLNLFSGVQMAIVILSADLRIRRFTPMAQKILNLIPTDVGRPISDIQLRLSLTDLSSLLVESIRTMSAKEQEVQDKQGHWYLLRIRPYEIAQNKIDGAVILLVDIDELKRNQDKSLRQAQLLDQTWEPIFIWDFAGIIQHWNKGAEETYGFTKEQAIGQIRHQLLNTLPPPGTFEEAFKKSGRWTGEIVQIRQDGKRLVFDSRMTVVRDPDGKRVVIEVDHPITERKEREEIMRRRAEELASVDRNRNEFLAMLAHELRNPLAPLRNAIEVLKLPVEAATSDQAKDIILRQVQNLARMVDDLLDVSRVTQRKITLSKQPVELMAFLKQVVESYRLDTEKRDQNLSLALTDYPVYVEGDVTRLEQIFGNLLNNAMKYTPSGGHLWLTAQAEPNTEAISEAGPAQSPTSQVVVRVRDDGIGLSPEALPRVFDLFMQSNRSLDRAQGGLGIGLTLVKELVELHGGTVEAHSQGLGRGSEFTVRLPALSMATVPEVFHARLENELTPASRKVLVVDDNEDEARSLAMFMQLVGHEVQVAHDGTAALQIAHVFQPDIVLLDIGLPGMNGFEVASQLRQNPELQKPYLIAVTGYGQKDDRRRTKEAGFDYHFTKPIEPSVLQDLIRDFPLGNKVDE